MEMRIDNLQMDMTGVELSVANAHLQVQRLEEDVIEPLVAKMDRAPEGHRIVEANLDRRVEAMLGYAGSVGTALWYEIEED